MLITDNLKNEHDIIIPVLDAARNEAEFISQTKRINAPKIGRIIDFFKNFIVLQHFEKEEKKLQPFIFSITDVLLKIKSINLLGI